MIGFLLALPSVRALCAVSMLIGLALLPIPLLAVHGAESAVALGAILPALCAALAVRVTRASQIATDQVGASAILQRVLVAAGFVLLIPVAVLALNQLRVRNCAPLEGLAFMALGPAFSVALAALVGTCIAAAVKRVWLATALAVLVPVADYLRALYGFYATPTVFAYGHFFGYYHGSLYDELLELPTALLSLRLITTSACVACACLFLAHYDPHARRLRLSAQAGKRGARSLLLLSAGACFLGQAAGENLGHRSSVAFISEQLGRRVVSQRCELILPRELRRQKRERIAADCDFRVRQLERWLGVRQPGRIRVFWFRSADEKQRLMGAAGTNIAKPWRREIYLQDDAWPHSVMPHELAHIVFGNVGRGPLRVTGKLFGLLPDFALIEGAAVAGAWANSSGSGMTPHQWSRAMLELKLMPHLSQLVGTGFLAQQTRLAYTISGSLLRYVADSFGREALRRIYASGDIEKTLGISLSELERRFHAYLARVPLPPEARELATLRFQGTSILSSVCPHVKARLKQELEGYRAADDPQQAASVCAQLLAIDPNETAVRAVLVALDARRGRGNDAERELERLIGPPSAPPPLISAARQALADERYRSGDFEAAKASYRALLQGPNERDGLRLLQGKLLALEGTPRARQLLFDILIGEPGQATDPAIVVHLARELRTERNDGLPQYLEARQLYARERYADAAQLLAEARELGLPTPAFALEAHRLLAISLYATSDYAGSRGLWQQQAKDAASLALVAEAEDWLARIDDATTSRLP